MRHGATHPHLFESGPLRSVHLSCHKWPRGLVNYADVHLGVRYVVARDGRDLIPAHVLINCLRATEITTLSGRTTSGEV